MPTLDPDPVAAIALTLTPSRRRFGAIYLTGDLLGRANASGRR
jgi:hypothetical protein